MFFDFITESKDNYIKTLEGKYKNPEMKVITQEQPLNEADEKLKRLIQKNVSNGNTAV